MFLPSGPANTRCSACRFEPRSLHVQHRRAPGTGLQSPETGSQNRRYRDLSRRQRPHLRIRTRGNARKLRAIRQRPGNIGSHRTAWWWMQPPSNRSHPSEFPDNRENTRNFARFGPVNLILRAQSVSSSKDLPARFPCNGTGNFLGGNWETKHGIGILRGIGIGEGRRRRRPVPNRAGLDCTHCK